MTTNSVFPNYTNNEVEQDLINSLIVEVIQIKGMDIKYLPRTFPAFDYLYGEDPNSAFNSCKDIEMYLENVDGFEGEGDLFSKFGYVIKKSCTMTVAKSRFSDVFSGTPIRPLEGDVIYIPMTKAILEIKYVDCDDPFYQLGKQYVYKLKCELFEFSHEEVETSDTEVDSFVQSIIGNVTDPSTQIIGDYGDNDKLQTSADPLVVFDPDNPFGGR